MEKRFEEMSASRMVRWMERATETPMTENDRKLLVRGADEEDLVNSGLDETMTVAYHQIRDVERRYTGVPDLRTAAFLLGIEKIATIYLELGIFP